MFSLERGLLWFIWGGIFLLLFTPLVVAQDFFFPFISGKNFYFRIITELLFGAYVALAFLKPEFRPRRSPLLLALGAFLGALTVSTIFGVDPYHSFWSNFERMEGLITHLHLAALFLVLAHTIRSEREWFIFLNISIGVSAVAASHGFIQSIGKADVIGGGRVFAALGNSIYLAVYLMFHMFFLAMLVARMKHWALKSTYAVLFFFELYVFIEAASRGAFLGFLAGVVIAGSLFILLSKNKIIRTVGAVSMIAVFALLAMVLFVPENPLVKNTELLNRLSSVSVEGLGDDPRVMIWGVALDGFKEKPLFGWGPENFVYTYAANFNPNLFGNEPWFDRAHNMLLEWLVATGVVGFMTYMSIFIISTIFLWKFMRWHRMSQTTAIIFFALIFAYIIQNIFVFDNIITYILVIGLLAHLHHHYYSWHEELQVKDKLPVTGPASQVGAAAAIIAVVVFAVYLNAKPMQAASQIIVGLQAFQGANANTIISEFKAVTDLDTFGTTEGRERLADTIIQIAVNVDNLNEAYSLILDYGIDELEKELEINASPRIPLFLGKLYTVKFNLSGEGGERAEEVYTHLQSIAPNYVQTHLAFAELYLIRGDNKNAVKSAKMAYDLPDQPDAAGAIFFPVFSVFVVSGSFDDALSLMNNFRENVGDNIPIGANADIEITLQRSRRSSETQNKLLLFTEINRHFVEQYGYPQPLILLEMIEIYRGIGEPLKASKLLAEFATEDLLEKARAAALEGRNTKNASDRDRFIAALDKLK